jgi:hypothetical protein
MTDFKNRIGHDNFVWWIGVVENNVDPLNLGRCKVRIFGSHTDNLQEIPTSELPWATPLNSVNNSRSFSTPMEGDYVFGFFMDGLSSQSPAMLGVFPAIPQQEVDEVAGKGFNAKAKYTNSVLNESDAITPVVYTDTPAMKPVRRGESTAPATAYKYSGTGIQKSDNSRAHVCDIPNLLRFEQALESFKSSTVFQAIRKGIEAVTAAAASSPLTTQIVGAIKVLRGILRAINEFLDFINGVLLEIARYIAYVQKMIAWLLSLPAELLKRFSDCLASLQNSLLAAVTGTSSGTSELVSEFTGLVRDISTTINATGATISASQNALNPNSFSGRI